MLLTSPNLTKKKDVIAAKIITLMSIMITTIAIVVVGTLINITIQSTAQLAKEVGNHLII
jgi:hypothetical protein